MTVQFKQDAAEAAVDSITNGMVIGLGHGSTAIFAIRKIAQLLKTGTLEDIIGIPCSLQTKQQATELGIPLTTLEDHPNIDITIDGADEIDFKMNMIKGGGGALLREKIVAQASKKCIYIADETKYSEYLGEKWAVPVEVMHFGWRATAGFIESLGAKVVVRQTSDGSNFHTDQNNLIMDCNFGVMKSPEAIADALKSRAGIVEHGLFVGIADEIIIAGNQGLRIINR
ncbi:MAG: ribose 5-phosphate isomerase A [Ignavibacteriae bacterium]|nr:ribose 5-phosphate isomerase A [Ignavibacteriota bacterium]